MREKKRDGVADGAAADSTPTVRRRLLGRLITKFDLPGELDGGLTLELHGRRSLLVGGCREIVGYTPSCVRLRLRNCELEIRGDGLEMTTYYEGQMGVDGIVRVIEFIEPEKPKKSVVTRGGGDGK